MAVKKKTTKKKVTKKVTSKATPKPRKTNKKKKKVARKVARYAPKKTVPDKDKPLNSRQLLFVAEYLIDLNATQAAIRAGYSKKTATDIACENLAKPNIAAAITKAFDARIERTEIDADRILVELGRIALSDMRDFVDWGPHGVTLKNSDELSDDAARCVSEVSETITKDGGSIKFKLHDKKGALELAGKHIDVNAFKEKVELTGKNGEPIEHIVAVSDSIPWKDVRGKRAASG